MMVRNSILIGAAVTAAAVVCLGASDFIAPATAAAQVKQTMLKSTDAGLMRDRDADAHARYDVNGTASWYGGNFDGQLDARGERFDSSAMTAAHRTLPLNSSVLVTNLDNGRHVVVRITDRGPYAQRRVIDLSRAAAEALGYVEDGTARVNVRTVSVQ